MNTNQVGLTNTTILFHLVNNNNEVIGTATKTIQNTIRFGGAFNAAEFIVSPIGLFLCGVGFPMLLIDSFVSGINYYKIEYDTVTQEVVFNSIDPYKITDKMTIKIVSINGIDAEEAARNGYVRILSK